MDPTTIASLTSRLQAQSEVYSSSTTTASAITSYSQEHHRQTLLATTHALLHAVETPQERIARLCYADLYLFLAARVLVDLDVFRLVVEAGKPVGVEALARKAGADAVLLARLLKHVCSMGWVGESAKDVYVKNGVTDVLGSPEGAGVILDMFHILRVGDQLPEYLKSRNYQNPTNKDDSPFKHGFQTTDHYFEYINRPGRERSAEAFHNHMRFKTLGLKWHEMPDIMASAFGDHKASSEEDVLIVDIGGSSGHDLVSFRTAHPDIPGRLILQDLPAAISAAKTAANGDQLRSEAIEAMEHDFFTPQPVVGARVYYLKMVLHDWPDEQCKQILARLKPALVKGHSRILLNEIVVPDLGAGWFETGVDLVMLCTHAAQERRERDWRALVAGVEGLVVGEIWRVDGAVERVIEVLAA